MDDIPVFLTICCGPPKCLFVGEDKLRNLMDGCHLCKHVTFNDDGTQTIQQNPVQ